MTGRGTQTQIKMHTHTLKTHNTRSYFSHKHIHKHLHPPTYNHTELFSCSIQFFRNKIANSWLPVWPLSFASLFISKPFIFSHICCNRKRHKCITIVDICPHKDLPRVLWFIRRRTNDWDCNRFQTWPYCSTSVLAGRDQWRRKTGNIMVPGLEKNYQPL